MIKIEQNPYQLKDQDVEHFANRVKALVVNEKDQLLLCRSNGCFAFVGGHVEQGESLADALAREVLEETGILVDFENVFPIGELVSYDKNYFNSGKVAKSTITYFVVKTDEEYDLKKQNLDSDEKEGNFEIVHINLKDAEKFLKEDEGFSKKTELYKEMLFMIQQYKKDKESFDKSSSLLQVWYVEKIWDNKHTWIA